MARNPYEVLGLTPAATPTEIQATYRRLAIQHHPERGGSNATFLELGEAYRALADRDPRLPSDRPRAADPARPAQAATFDSLLEHFGRHGVAAPGVELDDALQALATGTAPPAAPLPTARATSARRGWWARLRGRR